MEVSFKTGGSPYKSKKSKQREDWAKIHVNTEVPWEVFEEEKFSRGWVSMPKDYIGTPIYEHATDYVTLLPTGETVMIRKSDGYQFENSGLLARMTEKQIERLRMLAVKRREERERQRAVRGVLYSKKGF